MKTDSSVSRERNLKVKTDSSVSRERNLIVDTFDCTVRFFLLIFGWQFGIALGEKFKYFLFIFINSLEYLPTATFYSPSDPFTFFSHAAPFELPCI